MDSLFENAQTYSDVLKRCSLPEVANWKPEDIERAFRWANYFKNVHKRAAQRQSLIHKLDVQFKEMGYQIGRRFAGEELSFNFLACSNQYLAKALLENSDLPAQLKEKILKEHSDDSLHKHLENLSAAHTLLGSLSAMHDKLTDCVAESEWKTSFSGIQHTNMLCLREDIKWQLTHSTKQLGVVVEQRLNELTHQDGGMEIILLALLYSPGTDEKGVPHESSNPIVEPVKSVVLEWLVKEISKVSLVTGTASQELSRFAKVLWSQDPILLGRVSSCHLSFFEEHIKWLVQEIESLQADVESSAVSSAAVHEKYKWIFSHFMALASAGDNAKDVCISLIKSRASLEMQSAEWASVGQAHLHDVWTKLYFELSASCKI